eukprot:5308048-Pyramimonas_sp.AAC.2
MAQQGLDGQFRSVGLRALCLSRPQNLISGYGTTVDGSVTQYTDGLESHTFSDGLEHHVVAFFYDAKGKMRYQWGMVWNFHSWAEVRSIGPRKGPVRVREGSLPLAVTRGEPYTNST